MMKIEIKEPRTIKDHFNFGDCLIRLSIAKVMDTNKRILIKLIEEVWFILRFRR